MYASSANPKARFQAHRARVRERGIAFSLTFDQWWQQWALHWPRRGSRRGQMAMTRLNKAGSFEVGNVAVVPAGRLTRSQPPLVCGSNHPSAKLTEQDIPRVQDMLRCGVGPKRIAALFGVTRNAIRKIKRGQTWQHLSETQLRAPGSLRHVEA